jgi:hypothetical protein
MIKQIYYINHKAKKDVVPNGTSDYPFRSLPRTIDGGDNRESKFFITCMQCNSVDVELEVVSITDAAGERAVSFVRCNECNSEVEISE